jgi:hypothetical protein
MSLALRRALLSLSVLAAASPAASQPTIPLTVSGNQATGEIQLLGNVLADLTITFEQVVGLNPNALEVSAALVLPLDPSLLKRLPNPGFPLPPIVVPPVAFPVMLQIEPSANSALSFSGVVTVSLHTHNLNLLTNSPLALFSGPAGASLSDMTASVGVGSYRVNGSGGGFSDFIIVADLRPLGVQINGKLDALEDLLALHAGSMPPAVLQGLQVRLAQARSAYNSGATLTAIAQVQGFHDDVKAASGSSIPDVWRANVPVPNVAGQLRAAADSLKFSLSRKASQGP